MDGTGSTKIRHRKTFGQRTKNSTGTQAQRIWHWISPVGSPILRRTKKENLEQEKSLDGN
jgi:hypothetical protein